MNIRKTLKRLIDDTQYVAALEKQNDLLKEKLQQEKDNLQKQKDVFKKEKEQEEADEEAQYKKRSRNYLRPITDMQKWLLENYEFRYNVITDVFEYRKKNDEEKGMVKTEEYDSEGKIKHDFEIIDKYAINTIAIEVQEAGIFVRDHFVERLIKSKYAQPYHPIRSYIDKVRGTWDGKDRIGDFLRRINPSDYCQKMGKIWLRAMVAQMAGYDEKHANSVMLTLVSTTQGLHKSTFLRSLLPNELRDYYTDDFSLNQKGNAQRKIVEFAIINDDELDKENFNRLPRSASFTGTSNRMNQILASLVFLRRSVLYVTYRSSCSWHNLYNIRMLHEEISLVEFLTPCKDTKKYQNTNKKTGKNVFHLLFIYFSPCFADPFSIRFILYIIMCTHTIILH